MDFPGCFVNKTDIEMQSIAVQTDCTDINDYDVVNFHSPGSSFLLKGMNKMQKLMPCKGDDGENDLIFDHTEVSSIEGQGSSNSSFFGSFINVDNFISSPKPKLSFEIFDKKFLSPKIRPEKNVKLTSVTPQVRQDLKSSLKSLDESYEELITTIGASEKGLKESFIQLILVEKLSLRDQIRKNRIFKGRY